MNHAVQKHIPEGYLEDQAGRLVPVANIDEIDLTRDDLVKEIVVKAQALQHAMLDFKLYTLGDIAAFVELSAERYDVKLGGKKGNVSLLSFDGKYKIQRAINEYITFDERLQVAKALIDTCIHRWAEGADTKIRALVDHAFQVDKQGNINTARVLGLRRIKIDDSDWANAMEAIADSIQVAGSKTYVRLYERVGDSDQFRPIALDIAAL